MKIKTIKLPYKEVNNIQKAKKLKPKKPSIIFRTLVKILSHGELKKARFKFTGEINKKGGPYLILMNHSSFIDLKIAHGILYPMPFSVVSTHDALVGKKWLMRNIGCMPTRKFVSDVSLINDMRYMLNKKKTSVLMYPEAGYSFDGKATVLPDNFGRLVKILNVPVVFITTNGAFHYDPLYNGLQLRKVPVSAHVETLFTKEQIEKLSLDEVNKIIEKAFSFDNFLWQKEEKIKIDEPFRADGLERIIYRCANCNAEGEMVGKGTTLSCKCCGKSYTLTEYGELKANEGETEFSHVPDWYAWQRQKIKEEILLGEYSLDVPVEIGVIKDYKALYMVGAGRLKHSAEGFELTSLDGQLNYKQKTINSYGLNADYFWYEMGDVIGIGDNNELYYCFPPKNVPVAKVRLATEELYKIYKAKANNKE
ncbi:MAG: 1-acyl-sn-glycerol-3-phosphate acyltransferase [Clostridia bacterium]|nr:1-acyl-sn-glycerol-3-phosphate acyltransferase [Clostridia bacterium]